MSQALPLSSEDAGTVEAAVQVSWGLGGDSGLSIDSCAGHLHTGGSGSPGQGGGPFRKRFRMT